MESSHKYFMSIALEQAKRAASLGEVPVGAVIVRDGEVISHAHNLCETNKSPTAHAELLAIEKACEKLNSWRLHGCTLYVTLEPCPMCTGAAINARVSRIVFAAKDPRAGACGSIVNLIAYPLEARPEIVQGIMHQESLALMRDFFQKIRKKSH